MSNGQLPVANQTKLIVETATGAQTVDIYSEEGLKLLTMLWLKSSWQHRVSYQLTWQGVPIIQLPEDMLMMQQLIYKVRPDVIVETGTAHGGSAIFYASILELLGKGRVVSIDIEIRQYNRLIIESHPLSRRITLLEGSSTDDMTIERARREIRPQHTVLVTLDSNHTYAHTRQEMEKYAPLVTPGSYLVVFDGVMAILADAPGGSAGWTTDNPTAAARDFLAEHSEFEIDPYYNRLGLTYCPGGFLRRRAE